jgi:hypothetical protein
MRSALARGLLRPAIHRKLLRRDPNRNLSPDFVSHPKGALHFQARMLLPDFTSFNSGYEAYRGYSPR